MNQHQVKITDLCDANPDIAVVEPLFCDFGGISSFSGSITTLKVHEDNVLVRSQLEKPGDGRVLVVDGGGSKRCALLGDQLAKLGVENRWAGIVVYGCVRDSVELKKIPWGIKALTTHPKKSAKKGVGEVDIPINFGGVTFMPNHFVYVDEDGIVVAPQALT